MRQAVIPALRAAACLAGLLGFGWSAQAAAQNAAPLRKSDLVRLLSNPLIQRGEVAEVVRRNCLTFQPTQRDWSDLRTLGADTDVLSSVGGCAARGAQRTAPPAPPAPPAAPAATTPVPAAAPAAVTLVAVFLAPRVAAAAGATVPVQIQVRRADGTQARGVALALRATPRVAGGPPGEMKAVTDDSGFALVDVPVGRLAGRYRIELASGSGMPLPGRPVVDLLVRPGPPATADVRPPRLELGPPGASDTALGVLVAVRDSFGNGVPQEPIELRPGSAAMGMVADTAATDSLGRVAFVVRRAALRQPGQLEVRARGATLASLDAVVTSPPPPPPPPAAVRQPPEPAPTPELAPRFVAGTLRRGLPRTHLGDAPILEVRNRAGAPLAGKTVTFQATNAQIDPTSGVTDSAGQVRVEVTLGTKAGMALVTAVVDSVRAQDTLQVVPGAAVELVLERDGQRVDGGRILVELGVPFGLTLRARDGYGNMTSTASLTGRLQELRSSYNTRPERKLDLLAVQPEDQATVLMFKPMRLGSTDLMIAVGLTTTVSVEVVPPSR